MTLAGVIPNATGTAGVTVRTEPPLIPDKLAEIVAVPGATLFAFPLAFTVATLGDDDVHVAV